MSAWFMPCHVSMYMTETLVFNVRKYCEKREKTLRKERMESVVRSLRGHVFTLTAGHKSKRTSDASRYQSSLIEIMVRTVE